MKAAASILMTGQKIGLSWTAFDEDKFGDGEVPEGRKLTPARFGIGCAVPSAYVIGPEIIQ